MAGAKSCPACRARGHDTSPRGAGRVTRFESLRTVSPASRPCQGSDPRHGVPTPRSETSSSSSKRAFEAPASPVAVLPQCRRDPAEVLRAELNAPRSMFCVQDGAAKSLHDRRHNVQTHDFTFHDIELDHSALPGGYVPNPPTPWQRGAVSAHANAVAVAAFVKDVLRRNSWTTREKRSSPA